MNSKKVDVLIVGGGLIGVSLSLTLAAQDLEVLLIENYALSTQTEPHFDARSLALAPASINILQSLNMCDALHRHASPVNTIHISQQGHFGSARLKEKEPLGSVIELYYLQKVLMEAVNPGSIWTSAQLIGLDPATGIATIEHESSIKQVHAQLIVAADGTHSRVRGFTALKCIEKDYNQHAISANIGLARAHEGIAYERFTPTGPLAMLPLTEQRSALVWALDPEKAALYMQANETTFLNFLQKSFGYRLGRFTLLGKRSLHPLKQVFMPQTCAWPIVFIGNAAHSLHPVAGQGFNLGLRDVAMLAQCIVNVGLNREMLNLYQSMRTYDQQTIRYFTHGLVSLFTTKLPGMGYFRGLGLLALEHSPSFKALISEHAKGFAGISSDLACQVPL